jgi:hypothetical protein
VSDETQSQADTLRGILRVTVGGEERRVRKLKLHPAEEWFDRNARSLGPIAQIDASAIEGDLEATARLMAEFSGALIVAIVDYDVDDVLGGAGGLADDIYPEELLPLFLALRDAALPFAELLRDHRGPAAGGSDRRSSTNGRSLTGASTPTPSASDSTPAS